METITISRDDLRTSPQVGGSTTGNPYKGSRNVWLWEYNGIPAVVKREYRGSDNRREVECWAAVEGTPLAEMFAPVLAHSDDHDWIVMARAETVLCDMDVHASYECGKYVDRPSLRKCPKKDDGYSSYHFKDAELTMRYEQFRRDLQDACAEVGVDCQDVHPGNVALMSDGRMVMIDYGFFEVGGNGSDRDFDNCSCTACRRES